MSDNRDSLTATQAVHTFEPLQNERTGRWYSMCTCDWSMTGVTWPTRQAAADFVQAKHIDRAAEAVAQPEPDDAVGWIRAELIGMAVRSFTDCHGDVWIETSEGSLSMVDAPEATFVGWPFVDVQRVFGPLTQVSGDPLPLVHATSRWQRLLGLLGIRMTAWCGARIVAGRPSGASRECRECRRAVDGER